MSDETMNKLLLVEMVKYLKLDRYKNSEIVTFSAATVAILTTLQKMSLLHMLGPNTEALPFDALLRFASNLEGFKNSAEDSRVASPLAFLSGGCTCGQVKQALAVVKEDYDNVAFIMSKPYSVDMEQLRIRLREFRNSVEALIQVLHTNKDAYLVGTTAPYRNLHDAEYDKVSGSWDDPVTLTFKLS